jgi:hypothetical protein
VIVPQTGFLTQAYAERGSGDLVLDSQIGPPDRSTR